MLLLFEIDKKVSLLTLVIDVSDCVEVPSFCLTTADKISILDITSEKPTVPLEVVEAELVPPVIVSDEVKVPEGIVIAKEVEEGTLVTEAVAELVPPVIVSPTEKLAEEATDKVSVPKGYSLIPLAKLKVSWLIVQRFKPLLAQSANKIFKERLAVLRS